MHDAKPSNINYKLSTAAVSLLVCIIALPSILLLAKVTVGLSVILLGLLTVKIVSRVISDLLKENNTAQDQASGYAFKNSTRQGLSVAVGAVSLFVSGISFFAIAKAGVIAACSTIAVLSLYECAKEETLGKEINKKLDNIANRIHDFAVDSIENFITTGRGSR